MAYTDLQSAAHYANDAAHEFTTLRDRARAGDAPVSSTGVQTIVGTTVTALDAAGQREALIDRVIQSRTPAGASSLTISRAKKLTRRALRRMQGRRYTRRAPRGHRISCRRASATKVRCKLAWRSRGSRFAGTALIVQDPKLTRVTLRIRAAPSR